MWLRFFCCLKYISLIRNLFTLVEFSPSSGVTHYWEWWAMWSKVGRFMEVLYVVDDIVSKISVHFVLNYMSHYYVCVYFYGFFLCVVYTRLYIYGYFLSMLHVYVYCYFSVNPFIYKCICMFTFYIQCFHKSSVCIYFNCVQFKNFMRHNSIRCWVCYNMFRRENVRVLWHSMA